ncbi:hypothetical protein RRG08_049073 [Elysia crispata]|uniref:Uncharacterized protein n=1 Tax=Elysia crispata TaxID=231223 RepID=A0AAE1A9R3_9GAST|nr:hypothetical protein RRG08_049073 [Elysia crispata]
MKIKDQRFRLITVGPPTAICHVNHREISQSSTFLCFFQTSLSECGLVSRRGLCCQCESHPHEDANLLGRQSNKELLSLTPRALASVSPSSRVWSLYRTGSTGEVTQQPRYG